MAIRRMFSKVITNSDLFLDMPISSQLLYFHLGMNADDDGFVQLNSIAKGLGSSKDDIKVLFIKNLLLQFEDGVVVITDWLINNEIRKDRYKETFYLKHKGKLEILSNRQYSIPLNESKLVVPKNNHLDTQVRLGKVRLDNNLNSKLPKVNYAQFIDLLNKLTNRKFKTTDKKGKRQFEYLISEGYTLEDFERVINNAYNDDYHIQSKFMYLTPEFLTRADKFERYLNIESKRKLVVEKSKEQVDAEFDQFVEKLKKDIV